MRARRALVRFYVYDQDTANRAAWAHTADERGHCVGCRSTTTSIPWPCLIAICAAEALHLTYPSHERSADG